MKEWIKEFLEKNWAPLTIVLVMMAMYVGLVVWSVDQERAEIENAILLINPPAEVVEGRVEKIVIVSEYDFLTGTEQEHGTAYLCSGQVWPIPDHQLDEISKWLKVYAPNRGCN